MAPNLDDFINQHDTAQDSLVQKQGETAVAGSAPKMDLDSFLTSHGAAVPPQPTPQSQDQKNIGAMGAFAQGVNNGFFGGFGDQVQATVNSGGHFTGPQHNQELTAARALDDQSSKNYPLPHTIGTLFGVGAGGVISGGISDLTGEVTSALATRLGETGLGKSAVSAGLEGIAKVQGHEAANLASKAIGSQFFDQLPKTLGRIASVANEGGIYSVGLNRADDLHSAVEAYKKGAALTGLLAVVPEAASGAFSVFSKSIGKDIKASYDYSKGKGDYVLTNAEPISKSVASLPDDVQTIVSSQLNRVGSMKSNRIQSLSDSGVEVPVKSAFDRLYNSLDNIKINTAEEAAVRDAVLKEAYAHEATLLKNGEATSADIGSVDQVKQSLQDSYRKGGTFYKYQGTEGYNALVNFEKNIRSEIARVDPKTGVYNDLYYNLSNAIEDVPSRAKFEAKALNPNAPSTHEEWADFTRHFEPRQNNKTSVNNRRFGIQTNTLIDPEAATILSNTRDLLDARIQPSLQDYSVLKSVEAGKANTVLGRLKEQLSLPALAGRAGQVNSLGRLIPDWQKSVISKGASGLTRGLITQGPSRLGMTAPALNEITQDNSIIGNGALETVK